MVDKEMLEAIGQMMDEKLKPVTARLDKLETKQMGLRDEILEGVKVLLDAEFGPRFKLLAENQDEILRHVPTEADEELLDTRIAAIEAVVKKHSREIAALKKAN